MGDFTLNPLLDPARRKGAALKGAAGTSDYPNQVSQFNNWLYAPMDRRPTPTPTAPTYTAASPGWHGPTTPVAPGSYSTPYGAAGVSNSMWNITTAPKAQYPATGAMMTGSGGPTGPDNAGSIIDTAPKATLLAAGAPTPPQNAMQRWSGGNVGGGTDGGMRPLSNARRYFWATGNIDARAPQADPSQNKGAVDPPRFNNEVAGHSNWQPGQAGFTFQAGGGHSEWSPW